MSDSQEITNKTNDNNDKKPNSIKLGIISQESSYINVFELFDSYFKYSKPDPCKIKDENKYEFSLLRIPQLSISVYNIQKIEDIHNKYNNIIHFYLIFIDINNKTTISFLDKTIDEIVDVDDNTLNQKCYIYGFFQNKNNDKINEETITTMLEAKGIEYYYNEIKNDDVESFSKLLDNTINDCNSILIEKFMIQKQNELLKDQSKSHCLIY